MKFGLAPGAVVEPTEKFSRALGTSAMLQSRNSERMSLSTGRLFSKKLVTPGMSKAISYNDC